jgi:hypothetical protein
MSPLNDFEKVVLEFERVVRVDRDDKNEAIRKTFAVSPVRYARFLDAIIRKDAALEHDSLLVRRLRRLRAAHIADLRSPWRGSPNDHRES